MNSIVWHRRPRQVRPSHRANPSTFPWLSSALLLHFFSRRHALTADPFVGSFDASYLEPHWCASGRVAPCLPEVGEEAFSIARVDDGDDVRFGVGGHPQLSISLSEFYLSCYSRWCHPCCRSHPYICVEMWSSWLLSPPTMLSVTFPSPSGALHLFSCRGFLPLYLSVPLSSTLPSPPSSSTLSGPSSLASPINNQSLHAFVPPPAYQCP